MTRRVPLIAFAFLLVFMWSPQSRAESWTAFGVTSDGSPCYYDRDSVHQEAGGLVAVWIRVIYSELEKTREILAFKKSAPDDNWDGLAELRDLYAIKCAPREAELRYRALYDEKGNVLIGINMLTRLRAGPRSVHPGSILDNLCGIVCQKK